MARWNLEAWEGKASRCLSYRLLGSLPIAEPWIVALHSQIGHNVLQCVQLGSLEVGTARWRGLAAQNLQQIWVTKGQDGGHVLMLAFPSLLGEPGLALGNITRSTFSSAERPTQKHAFPPCKDKTGKQLRDRIAATPACEPLLRPTSRSVPSEDVGGLVHIPLRLPSRH